ncbi:MAG: hypothetical protein WCT26_01695 [Candidatus Buchananbacteria bacterium]|jgi:hypothetical protein
MAKSNLQVKVFKVEKEDFAMKILQAHHHGGSVAAMVSRCINARQPEWQFDFDDRYDELGFHISIGEYDALILDIMGPSVIDGQGRFPDIGRHETDDGMVTGIVLALRLKEFFPNLAIVVKTSKFYSEELEKQCLEKGVELIDAMEKPEEVIEAIKRALPSKP